MDAEDQGGMGYLIRGKLTSVMFMSFTIGKGNTVDDLSNSNAIVEPRAIDLTSMNVYRGYLLMFAVVRVY